MDSGQERRTQFMGLVSVSVCGEDCVGVGGGRRDAHGLRGITLWVVAERSLGWVRCESPGVACSDRHSIGGVGRYSALRGMFRFVLGLGVGLRWKAVSCG